MHFASRFALVSILDKTYSHIRKSIVDGAYKPGQRLRALRLAKELKISRTPVKEALGRLEQEGLLRRELGSGYVVRGLSVSDILDLYKVREVLELEAAREALPNLTEEALRAMRGALAEADVLLKKNKLNNFLRANRKFHNIIVSCTRNSVLQEILNNLDARFWSIGTIVVSVNSQRAQDIRRENHAILDALAARDIKNVERAVRAHVRGAAENIRLVTEREPQHLMMVAA
jgi:DNA-binding GntR family transcriptional regulator